MGSFRVRVRGGVRVRFWLGPGTQLDPLCELKLSTRIQSQSPNMNFHKNC